jgi:hypothetical protein
VSIATTASQLNTVVLSSPSVVPEGWCYFALSFNDVASGSLYGAQSYVNVVPNIGVPTAMMTAGVVSTNAAINPAYFTQTGNSTAAALDPTAAATAQYVNNIVVAPDVFYRVASVDG